MLGLNIRKAHFFVGTQDPVNGVFPRKIVVDAIADHIHEKDGMIGHTVIFIDGTIEVWYQKVYHIIPIEPDDYSPTGLVTEFEVEKDIFGPYKMQLSQIVDESVSGSYSDDEYIHWALIRRGTHFLKNRDQRCAAPHKLTLHLELMGDIYEN